MKWQAEMSRNDVSNIIDLVWWSRQRKITKPSEFWCSLLGRMLSPNGTSDELRALARVLVSASTFQEGDDWHTCQFEGEVIDIQPPDCGVMTVGLGMRVVGGFYNEVVQDIHPQVWLETIDDNS